MTPVKRLTHTSNAAFRRYMQLSTAKVFVFVEGKTDRYLYSKICESVTIRKGIPFQICLAQELPDGTGGKPSLLRFLTYLKRIDGLVDDFKGKKKVSIFYMDKDIDDVLRRIRCSDHVVYTDHYSIENYLFSDGDLVHAVAAVASLTLADVRRSFPRTNKAWQRLAAENWKEWVKLCVYSVKSNIRYASNYSVSSRINSGPYTPVDRAAHAVYLVELERRSPLSALGFKRSFACVSRYVDRQYDDDHFDSVFNGKWYLDFLSHDASRIAGGAAIHPGELLKALKITLNPNATWVSKFKKPLEAVIAKL